MSGFGLFWKCKVMFYCGESGCLGVVRLIYNYFWYLNHLRTENLNAGSLGLDNNGPNSVYCVMLFV